MNKGQESNRSFKLRTTASALNAAVNTYENMINGDIDHTPKLKEAVENSIIELSTAICNYIKKQK